VKRRALGSPGKKVGEETTRKGTLNPEMSVLGVLGGPSGKEKKDESPLE